MPYRSRRRVLQTVAVAGAVALAGCSAATNSSRNLPPPPSTRLADFETIAARNGDGDPLVVSAERTAEGVSERAPGVSETFLLTEEADLDEVRFRAGSGVEELEAFVTATDFESATVYLLQREIGECYDPRLVGVYREGDGVDVELCRAIRPAGVECDADDRDVFAVAIRISADDFSGFGGGGIGDCGDRSAVPLPGGEAA